MQRDQIKCLVLSFDFDWYRISLFPTKIGNENLPLFDDNTIGEVGEPLVDDIGAQVEEPCDDDIGAQVVEEYIMLEREAETAVDEDEGAAVAENKWLENMLHKYNTMFYSKKGRSMCRMRGQSSYRWGSSS